MCRCQVKRGNLVGLCTGGGGFLRGNPAAAFALFSSEDQKSLLSFLQRKAAADVLADCA